MELTFTLLMVLKKCIQLSDKFNIARVCEDIKNQIFQVILNGWTQVSAGTSIRLRRVFVAFPMQFCGTTSKACCSRADSVSVCGDVPGKAESI